MDVIVEHMEGVGVSEEHVLGVWNAKDMVGCVLELEHAVQTVKCMGESVNLPLNRNPNVTLTLPQTQIPPPPGSTPLAIIYHVGHRLSLAIIYHFPNPIPNSPSNPKHNPRWPPRI